MTHVSSDDDLDWEFAFDSRLGHPTGSSEEPMAKRSKKRCEELPILHPDAAGIDVGASELFVAVSADRDPQPVRSFPTFTRDLNALADWLQQCGIHSVAMESTSVYWIPVYQILESRGLEVCLVNAQHVKNVPGRKTDVSDCQWLQCRACAAHAEGAGPNEPPDSPCPERHHRTEWPPNTGRHPRWRTKSRDFSSTLSWWHPGHFRRGPETPGPC
jgi:Transposase